MIFELSQSFYFEAAHTLERERGHESSNTVHGHTYLSEVTVAAHQNDLNGMVMDLSQLKQAVEAARAKLDHQFLNHVQGLGIPTLENLCLFIMYRVNEALAGRRHASVVSVSRTASGDRCALRWSDRYG